jgi:class 3 adenylate cyclase/tetratricopeptide (TPR) repeat protein/ketosteroid isomerase-like protein
MTVVFADLVGSTPLQEQMDAESVRHVMNRFYDAMRLVVEGHGGRVAKFIGDAVMAVFGAPAVREDDAERAVRAAAAMVATLPALNDELERQWGVRIGMRTGVNTGEIVESSEEGLIVGDPANIAARLEQVAADGEVLVGASTWRLTRHRLTFATVPPLDLKGKSEPVVAYRLVSLDPPGAESSTRFIGRHNELGRLRGAFDRVTADNRARLATVIGSPGVGKTRLAREFTTLLGGEALLLDARCEPAGTSTFSPIAVALRGAASIDEAASDAEVVEALSTLLPASQPDRERVATRAATVLGAGAPAPPEETFWAVRRIFEAMACVRPVVLVLDDIHWAEPMLLDLIEHLADWARDAPLLLLALARPELRDVRPTLAEAGSRDAVVLLLEGLDAEASERLAADLLDAERLPTGLQDRILASSEGNPLFLRELVRMLVDDGVLRKEDGAWVVTVEASDVDVPPTINALLSARIDRLPADERVVIERASVMGKHFYRGAVAALAPPLVASSLDRHLETLRRKELVEPEGTYWIDEPVFRFHHVLIRDAAYRRLLKEARADLHERFASWVEGKAGDLVGEHEEVVGYHLEQAHEYHHQLGPLDGHGHDLGRRAAEHLGRAGRRAIERDDLPAAAPLLARALARVAPNDPQRPELLLDRCEALLGIGAVIDATEALQELRAPQWGSPRLGAWATAFTAELATMTDPTHLRVLASEVASAAATLEELGDIAGAAKAHDVAARIAQRLGQHAECEAALDRALAAARSAGDRRRANAVLAGAPLAALWGPAPVARASGRCLDVVRVLRITTGAPAVEAAALRCQAVLEALRGRDDAARKMLASASATLEELGLERGLLEVGLSAGIVETLAGDWAAAEPYLRSAHDGLRRLHLDSDAASAGALLASACARRGAYEEAEDLTLESERLAGDDLSSSIAWRTARSGVLVAKGEVSEALRLAEEAVALAETTDALVDHAGARLALARALAAAARQEDARFETGRGIELYQRKGATAPADEARRVSEWLSVAAPAHEQRIGHMRVAPGVARTAEARLNSARQAMISHDGEALAACLHPDVVMTDERVGLRAEVTGREATAHALIAACEGRQRDAQWEIVACRGRVGVARVYYFGTGDPLGGSWESERVMTYAMDPANDLILRLHVFDAADRDAAIRAYEEWAAIPAGGEGPQRSGGSTRARRGVNPSHLRVWNAVRQAHLDGDWEAFGRLLQPTVVVTDLRSGLRSEIVGRDAWAQGMGGTYSARPMDIDGEILVTRGPCGIAHADIGGPGDTGGGQWDLERLAVYELGADALVRRVCYLDAGEIRRAFALLDEWTRGLRGVSAMEGTSPRHQDRWERFREALVRQDWEAFVALHAPDFRYVDHRAGLRSEVVGRAAYVQAERETYDLGTDLHAEIITTAGHAGIMWARMFGADDAGRGEWESQRLTVYLLDSSDELEVRGDTFDPSDRDAAFSLFDGYANRGGVRGAPGVDPRHVRCIEQLHAPMIAKDWRGLESRMNPDVVLVDRRPGLQAEYHGSQEYARVIRESYGTRDFDWDVEVLASRGNACVFISHWFGRDDDVGGPWETDRLVLIEFDDDDRFRHAEIFERYDLDAAVGALAKYSHSAWVHGLPEVDPRHLAAWQRFRCALVSKDWSAFAAVLHPDLVHIDKRSGLRSQVAGRDEYIRVVRESFGTREINYSVELIASRGQFGIGYNHLLGTGDEWGGPFEAERLVFFALSTDGTFVRFELFDPGDVESAKALLAPSLAQRVALDFIEAYNLRDWERLRDLLAPDVVLDDHRPLGWGRSTGFDDFFVRIQTGLDASPDAQLSIEAWLRQDERVVLFSMPMRGHVADVGGGYELDRLILAVVEADRIAHMELFDASDDLQAIDRFTVLSETSAYSRASPIAGESSELEQGL